MNDRKTWLGILGVLGIWLTAGIALPMINSTDLRTFNVYQLMTFRGFLTILFIIGTVVKAFQFTDRYTYLIALTLPFATLGLYQGTRYWGAGPTIIIVTTTPILNILVRIVESRKISLAVIASFILVLIGVVIANWNGHFHWQGFG